ncbi:hypothetical protein Pla110_30090 [Polystyrenella longa]|uniref:Cytochrome c domain-containing protein n=1 Tax=Polystyrenella longa TaxID=2528007 RepID=A0A518CPX8_9PLAN|nr:hypothetical protein [Polystyrenella longa]QDU81269.1 hypothetical protein Pla110_30090 [Polystyrenella longa]
MRTARKMLSLSLIAGLMVTLTVVMNSDSAQARPNYKKVITKTYEDNAEIKKLGCLVCHPAKETGKGVNPKMRNLYGMAVGKALGEEKVKDEEKIQAALEKAAGEKSEVEGKTFGDLIMEGMVPFTAPE